MSLFHSDKPYRLRDRKEKKPQEVRHYKPPRPLSWLSCGILILFGAVLLYYGASILIMRYAGTETEAAMNTRLVDGQVVPVEILGITTTAEYTYRDGDGAMHGSSTSLIGNKEPLGDTILVRYFPPIPGWSMPSFRASDTITAFGALLLGVILLCTAIRRLQEIRSSKEGAEADRDRALTDEDVR